MSSRIIKARRLYSGMPRLVSTTGSSVKVVVRDGTDDREVALTSEGVTAVEDGVIIPSAVAGEAAEAAAPNPRTAPMDRAAEAAGLVDRAQERAGEIIAQAREEVAAIREAAYREGLAAGREEAFQAAHEESRKIVEEAEKVLAGARSERAEIVAEAQPEIIRLALAVAGRLVREAAEADPEMAFRAALDGMKKVRDEEELTIRANPRDVVALEERNRELRTAVRGLKKLTITEDPTIEPGGCVIDSPRGSVDARLDRQLARASKTLRDVMNGEK